MSDHIQSPPAGLEWSYRISLTAKGLLGLMQLIGGLGLWLTPRTAILQLVDWMTANEIAVDPKDPLAQTVIGWAQHLSPQTENFYAIYLLGHGMLNFGIVVALLLRIRGSYHVSVAVLLGFVTYQLWRFSQAPDFMLLVLTAIDVVVIILVVMERHHSRPLSIGAPGDVLKQ